MHEELDVGCFKAGFECRCTTVKSDAGFSPLLWITKKNLNNFRATL